MNTATFNVPSITCSACSAKITEGIKTLQGINDVTVDLKSQTVKVDFDPGNIQPQDIKKKISSLGYEVMQ